jgi:hypothetical protein
MKDLAQHLEEFMEQVYNRVRLHSAPRRNTASHAISNRLSFLTNLGFSTWKKPT